MSLWAQAALIGQLLQAWADATHCVSSSALSVFLQTSAISEVQMPHSTAQFASVGFVNFSLD